MTARPPRLLDIVDNATAADPTFGDSVSAATWADYRARLGEYEAWLVAHDHSPDSWEVADNFAAFLEGQGRAAITKHRTAISKLVAAHRIVGSLVTNPANSEAVAAVVAATERATTRSLDQIAPEQNYRIADAASALGVSERTVRRRLDAAAFPDAQLEPSRTGHAWTIPGHNLITAFTEAQRPEPTRAAPDLHRIIAVCDIDTAAGARDRAILQLTANTDLSETNIRQLRMSDIDATISDTPVPVAATDDLDAWRSLLAAAGAGPSETLWPPINKGGRITLGSHPIRIGDVVRRRTTEAGSPLTGVRALREAIER